MNHEKLRPHDIARFWSKVDVGRANQCWLWRDAPYSNGYGMFRLYGAKIPAHRLAFELIFGRPAAEVVRHTCDTPLCCNPGHLEDGTVLDNARDRVLRNRGAHGEAHGKAKLTAADAVAIYSSRSSTSELARVFGVTPKAIRNVRQGKTWRRAVTAGTDAQAGKDATP
jgi:hypothetical protein